MNKYSKQNKPTGNGRGHNGTPNGKFGKKAARVERHNERVEANEGRTIQDRLASLDKRGLTAARERGRLLRKAK